MSLGQDLFFATVFIMYPLVNKHWLQEKLVDGNYSSISQIILLMSLFSSKFLYDLYVSLPFGGKKNVNLTFLWVGLVIKHY